MSADRLFVLESNRRTVECLAVVAILTLPVNRIGYSSTVVFCAPVLSRKLDRRGLLICGEDCCTVSHYTVDIQRRVPRRYQFVLLLAPDRFSVNPSLCPPVINPHTQEQTSPLYLSVKRSPAHTHTHLHEEQHVSFPTNSSSASFVIRSLETIRAVSYTHLLSISSM